MARPEPWFAPYERARDRKTHRLDSPVEIAHELAFAEESRTWFTGGVHDCA